MVSVLEVFLIKTNKSLAGRILKMDESLRAGTNDFAFQTSQGLSIKSYQYPEVNSNAVYLRGSETDMDESVFVGYPLGETPETLMDRVVKALLEFLSIRFQCIISVSSTPVFGGELIIFSIFEGRSKLFTVE